MTASTVVAATTDKRVKGRKETTGMTAKVPTPVPTPLQISLYLQQITEIVTLPSATILVFHPYRLLVSRGEKNAKSSIN